MSHSDRMKRLAKALKRLAHDELGEQPKHTDCLRIVEAHGIDIEAGDSVPFLAAKIFEAHRPELEASARRRTEQKNAGRPRGPGGAW